MPSARGYNLGCDYVRDGFNQPGVVHLEPPDHAVILFRVEANALNRIRTLSPDCEIDAGNVPVHWLTDVQPAQSIALLVSLMPQRDRLGESPLGAIAQHSDPAADQALERFLGTDQPESVRLRVISWMGSSRGRHGFDVLKRLIASRSRREGAGTRRQRPCQQPGARSPRPDDLHRARRFQSALARAGHFGPQPETFAAGGDVRSPR